MENDNQLPINNLSSTKKQVFILALSFFFAGLTLLLYHLFGKTLVQAVYEGRSFQLLNSFIQHQDTKNLDHYIALADRYVLIVLFMGLFATQFLVATYRIFFTRQRLPLFCIILFLLFLMLGVYLLGPNNRTYSPHGLWHSSIVYQILNGSTPPGNPFFAGQKLSYPWGYHYLSAILNNATGTSLPWIFAGINIISLCAAAFILFRLCRLITSNTNALGASVVTALFCTRFFPDFLLDVFNPVLVSAETYRTIPFIKRCFSVSGVPLGLAFSSLGLYAAIQFYRTPKKVRYSLLVYIACISCGFLYYQMLPGLLAGIGCMFLISPFIVKEKKWIRYYIKNGLLFLALVTAAATIYPYLKSLNTSNLNSIVLFNPSCLLKKLMCSSVFILPLTTIFWIGTRNSKHELQKTVIYFISAYILANLLCYYFINLPYGNEYKFILYSSVLFGLFAGIGYTHAKKLPIRIVFACLFIYTLYFSMNDIIIRINRHAHVKPIIQQNCHYVNPALNPDLYEWIRTQTPKNSVFIDNTLYVPIFAERAIFIGIDRTLNGKRHSIPGIGLSIYDFLNEICCISSQSIDDRMRINQKILSSTSVDSHLLEQLKDDFPQRPIYIIYRTRTQPETFSQTFGKRVFTNTDCSIEIYLLNQ
ncbi:MAG: hypothetical protein ACYTER_10955 [Planctomycetota bacterium]|jgi:hypothetical protein